MSVGIYFVADSTIGRNLYDGHEDMAKTITSNLGINAVDLLLIEDISKLQLLLKNTQRSDPHIVYMYIVGNEDQIVAHTFPGGFPSDLKKVDHPSDNQPYSMKLLDIGDTIIADIAVPVLHGSLGYAHAGFSLKAIEQKRKQSQQSILLICTVISLLAMIAAVLFSRLITKPLSALARGAEDIGKGNLDHRLDIASRDEIGITAAAFNGMAKSLQEDITKRVEVEKALKKSESLYRTLVENIDMGIVLIDNDHNVMMANAAQGRIFNKKSDQFIGNKCYQEFEKRDHVCSHCPGIDAMKTGKVQEAIAQGVLDDGSTVASHIRAFPMIEEDGQCRGFIEVVEDVSEKMKTQAELAAEKERLAVTLRSIGDGVITTDTSGNVVLLNKVAEKLTGWRSDDALGRPLEEVFHIINERTRERCENPFEKVVRTSQIVTLTRHTVLISKDGRELNIADSGAPILNTESEIIGVVLVFRDVTEQLKTEKELLKIKKLESVGILAGGIAHDFNNILAAILGNINLALFQKELSVNTRELLAEAEKASIRAKELTQQLLTFSKGGDPVKETSSLESVIKESANFVLSGDKVACSYKIPDDLWLVDIDKGQISQVIQNIVINASQAMPEGGSISICCENLLSVEKKNPLLTHGKYVEISIQDNGIGIPENLIDKIFDPYFTTKQKGSGLGLAICQSIIRKHGGDIFVQSSQGDGSAFFIYLPASDKPETISDSITETPKSSVQARILVMDDDEMVRNVAERMLSRLGNEVFLAKDGDEAIRLYQAAIDSGEPIQLVIMDLTIPGGMGGKEAVQEILKIDQKAKVIVSSGYSNDPVMAKFKDYGFSAAIIKPFQLQELTRVIKHVLEL